MEKKNLETMTLDEIMEILKLLGCTYTFEQIEERLKNTYNELSVADEIFETCDIKDYNGDYKKDFIDEAIMELCRRFIHVPYQHYGMIVEQFQALGESHLQGAELLNQFQVIFQSLIKMAKQFQIHSLDAIVYQVNDGFDLLAEIIEYLDTCMEYARMQDHKYFKTIITWVEKVMKQFDKSNPFFIQSLRFELAKAYVAIKSKKGEAMFLQMMKEDLDINQVVFQYGLAYLDDDEKKTLRIYDKYNPILDRDSEEYEIIQSIIEDIKKDSIL